MPDSAINDDNKKHRHYAVQFFNDTWALIEKINRTPDEDARMIHMAHASRMHWEFAGTAQNWSVGEWQIARVYSVLGMAAPAQYHARRCLELAQKAGITGFFLGSAHEGMARALRVGKDPRAQEHLDEARRILKDLTDPDDIKTLEADLAGIPS